MINFSTRRRMKTKHTKRVEIFSVDKFIVSFWNFSACRQIKKDARLCAVGRCSLHASFHEFEIDFTC